jgi:hypothetical protein
MPSGSLLVATTVCSEIYVELTTQSSCSSLVFGSSFPLPGVVDGLYCLRRAIPNLSPPSGTGSRYESFCAYLVSRDTLAIVEGEPSLVVWIDTGPEWDGDTLGSGFRSGFDEGSEDDESLWWEGKGKQWILGVTTFITDIFSCVSRSCMSFFTK